MDKDGCRWLRQPLNAVGLFGHHQSNPETFNPQQGSQTAGEKGDLSYPPWASAQGQPHAHLGRASPPPATSQTPVAQSGEERWPSLWGKSGKGQRRAVRGGKEETLRVWGHFLYGHLLPPTSDSHPGPE